ncbi:hypothetical protein GQ600_18790 [Phytophthora cactorum]|nr:hypothetical protein GQ600_18790 [Phytophthora cactorum]
MVYSTTQQDLGKHDTQLEELIKSNRNSVPTIPFLNLPSPHQELPLPFRSNASNHRVAQPVRRYERERSSCPDLVHERLQGFHESSHVCTDCART